MNLTEEKLLSIAKGAGIAGLGAGLAYLAHWATNTDLGMMGPIIGAALSVAVNFVRQLAKDNGDGGDDGGQNISLPVKTGPANASPNIREGNPSLRSVRPV